MGKTKTKKQPLQKPKLRVGKETKSLKKRRKRSMRELGSH